MAEFVELHSQSLWWIYGLLVACSAAEYVFPPLPGDALALAAAVWALSNGENATAVFAALTAGSIAGSCAVYGAGRCLPAHPNRWPSVLQPPRRQRAVQTLLDTFRRRGAVYLAINRFLPAFRAFFFLAAGVARLSPWRVVVFGGISAAAWNAAILWAAATVHNNIDRLTDLYEQYTVVAVAAVGTSIAAYALCKRLCRRTHGRSAQPSQTARAKAEPADRTRP